MVLKDVVFYINKLNILHLAMMDDVGPTRRPHLNKALRYAYECFVLQIRVESKVTHSCL